MRSEEKTYGLICEWKSEGPLVMEGKPLTSDEAHKKMTDLANNPKIIRVAIFRMDFVNGNETLLPKEPENA